MDKYIQIPNWTLEPYLGDRVLVWAAHHEHAVFGIHDEIHPAAKLVWFQFTRNWEEREDLDRRIFIYERRKRRWDLLTMCDDATIPYKNNNPFCPVEKLGNGSAFKHVAFSVFPQNQHKIPGTDETIEEVWQRDFAEWEVYPPIPGMVSK